MANQLLKSLLIGVKRRWWDGMRNGMAAVGGLWALTEMTTAALPGAKLALEAGGADYLCSMAAVFVGVFVGYRKLESTVRYLGIEVDDALELAEQIEL